MARRLPLALLLAASLALPATPARAVSGIPGIDVSQWQLKVDWPEVAASGVEFVIARATRGHDFLDPRYRPYRDHATEAGLVFGSYHRAKPSAEPGDALAEANHFVRRARNAPGDVIPALDIEETGGLSVAGLRDWVRTWLARVRDRLGVHPMIYTSPNFWRTNLGDTTWFAEHGYPLWIANWDVAQPQEIAEDWASQGWTYWQWTVGDPGDVPGIETAIDRDVFAGEDLLDGTIASLTVTPALGGTIRGPGIVCSSSRDRCDRLADPNRTVTLRAEAEDTTLFQGWTGACAGAGLDPACEVTLRGAVEVSAIFAPTVILPEDVEGSAFAWANREMASAAGGTYRAEDRAGARMAWDITGDRVRLRTIEGPAMGRARVSVDGAKVAVLTGWAPEQRVRGTTIDGLGPGPHVLSVRVLGTGPPRSTGTEVGVDAIRWGGALLDDPPPAVATWGPVSHALASDGRAVQSDMAGATAKFTFTGTAVSWITATGPDMGRAEVRIDGAPMGVVGLYDPVEAWGIQRTYAGLVPGEHVIEVRVQGRANAASTGTGVVVDGWIVI